jgi:hypothetical protein
VLLDQLGHGVQVAVGEDAAVDAVELVAQQLPAFLLDFALLLEFGHDVVALVLVAQLQGLAGQGVFDEHELALGFLQLGTQLGD